MALARILAAVAIAVLLGWSAARADDPGFFRIGTAGTAGTYFSIGGIIASAISSPPGSPNCQHGGACGVPGLNAVAQASQGSVENVELMSKHQLEAALVQAEVASWAYNGTGVFKSRGAVPNLRAIGAVFPESIHLVVPADSPIKSLRDLKGKRVGLGEKESGTLADVRLLLEQAGLSERDLKPDYSRLADAANGIRENTLDAFFLIGGWPIPAIADLANSTPIRLVPIDDETFAKMNKRYPFFSRVEIPGGTYEGVDENTKTAGVSALLVVNAEIPDALVYAITKSRWSSPPRHILVMRHPMGQRIGIEHALEGVEIPLHPGAERYYREAGLMSDTARTDPPK
ncbi:MAG: TAXI family TRAP transporter solute-binding subunit [Alphaproteobacteria bacterium]|nr:TAXI family TRAP transporter solute-binding subunit [Alphaproteobacteria bacterium]